MLTKIVDVLSLIIHIPAAIGMLGLILLMEKTESIPFRCLGGLIAFAMAPFMAVLFVVVMIDDLIEKIRYRKCNDETKSS